jgi:hypothetical protein
MNSHQSTTNNISEAHLNEAIEAIPNAASLKGPELTLKERLQENLQAATLAFVVELANERLRKARHLPESDKCVGVDLKPYPLNDNSLTQLKAIFTQAGYKVSFEFERTPDGHRDMVLRW